MKNSYLILWCIIGNSLWAQDAFPVKIKDFSDSYEAVIDRNSTDTLVIDADHNYVPEYKIIIKDKKTEKELLTTYTSSFPEYLLDEHQEALPNIKELPYGSQSVLIYEDVNFDGRNDFALMNGNNSCYSGPSFDIYLVNPEGNLVYSESFSDLSNNNCGMFHIDHDTKIIHTMVKSGCCWHQFSEYKVLDNEPKLVKRTEEAYLLGYPTLVEVTAVDYKNGVARETHQLFLPEDTVIIFSFYLDKNKKRVVVFQDDNKLYYALLQADETVEFYYPKPYFDETRQETIYDKITYNEKKKTLTFSKASARYELYASEKEMGVKVTTKGKMYNLKGNPKTATGHLPDVMKTPFTNLLSL